MQPTATKPGKTGQPSEVETPRKRFRIRKLEDRIAPKRGGKGTNNCSGSYDGGTGGTGTSSY